MKYILFIFLLASFNVYAQKPIGVYRIIEKTDLSYDEKSNDLKFDTVPKPMNTLNSKIIFRTDQLLIVDDDTMFINLGIGSKPEKDSNSVSMEWAEADYNGNACNVYLYEYADQAYDKLFVFFEDENIGYFYLLSPLKLDVIPTKNSVSVDSKKKSK